MDVGSTSAIGHIQPATGSHWQDRITAPVAPANSINVTNDVQDAVDRIRNKAEKFEDMSSAKVSLILFRCIHSFLRIK